MKKNKTELKPSENVIMVRSEEKPFKLNMTFEAALKKALNTPLPKKKLKKAKQL